MSAIHFRQALVRSDGTGRTVYGVAVPYGQTVDIEEFGQAYKEQFAPGSFARSIRERGDKVKLCVNHESRKLPIGRATELRETADGLHAAFAVSATRDGDEALQLVRDGVVDSFSVGFRPVRDRRDGDVVVRVEASLWEVSLVSWPAYAGAGVTGVRTAHPALSVDIARRRLELLLRTW
ncbi:HK97 family phage prohead protease [Streptomyces durmitorensis]|uniref:HK97 family phage prohead protease n=1 Tax=Streptomyces durmitorensis TaxID=319947 RepID=A0ABY4PRB0_9ACTN|nr:HK97 family phage prohead protease [Streptomyces durmitorensis]UQT55942.1 HK97 family phage prohead protease [Streptomyces durmitorensis]